MSSFLPGTKFSILLFSEKGLARSHAREVASWFRRCPGPAAITIVDKPVDLSVDSNGNLTWEAAFKILHELREQYKAFPENFVFLLTKSPNAHNWYAVQDERCLRNGFLHVGDFSWVTTAPASVISAHYLLKGIFNALVESAGVRWNTLAHNRSRGCLYDFCENKWELCLKIRTADICGDCMCVFRSIGIPEALISQTVDMAEALRRSALNTYQYLKPEMVFDRWPFPVAVTRHKAVQATNPLLRLLLLLDHFDCLVRYCFLAKTIAVGERPVLTERPSMGWWVDQLAQSVVGQGEFRDVARIAQREKIVSLRNERRGHGWMALEEEAYRDDVSKLETAVEKIEIEMTPFLESYQLLVPRDIKLVKGGYTVKAEHLIGSHLLHPQTSIKLDCEPRICGITGENEVFLADIPRRKFWNMSPYIISAVCPTCQHPRILITDGGDQFIDVFVGHRVEVEIN